ncbi:MAG: DUF2975 domain-containing protein [Thermoleophilia bacterium]|nr:DUF2975 domain-containing protein [Thermoleophilia bacterium]
MPATSPSRAATWGYVIVNLLLFAALAFGVFRLATTAVAAAGGPRRSIDVEAFLPRESVALPHDAHLIGDPRIRVHVAHPSKAEVVLEAGLELVPLVLIVVGLWLLRGVARSVRRGDPFTSDNVRRLRGIGVLLVGGAVLLAFVESTLRQALYDRLPENPFGNLVTEGFAVHGNAFVAGLGVFILAEVFAHGVRLREDVEATI